MVRIPVTFTAAQQRYIESKVGVLAGTKAGVIRSIINDAMREDEFRYVKRAEDS